MRGKLSENLSSYAVEEDRESFSKLLDDTESWLYGEGEEVTKSVYVKKLEELKAIGDPMIKRQYEYENRYDALNSLRSTIDQYKMTATLVDPKYEHIEQEDRNKVLQECGNVEKWINEQMSKQDKLAKHADVVITCADIFKKKTELDRFASAIMNKPKPKPKPEEKKPEEKKPEEQKPEEKKPEEKKPEDQKTPEPSKEPEAKAMDLD